MTEEEFLKLASKKYKALSKLGEQKTFYDYEKEFDRIWRELGGEVLQKTLGDVPKDRRKKKDKDEL